MQSFSNISDDSEHPISIVIGQRGDDDRSGYTPVMGQSAGAALLSMSNLVTALGEFLLTELHAETAVVAIAPIN